MRIKIVELHKKNFIIGTECVKLLIKSNESARNQTTNLQFLSEVDEILHKCHNHPE